MGGTLTFNKAAVAAEAARVKAAPEHQALYGEVTGPALWLVGDQGVYLMGNDSGRDPKTNTVVYAKECDPTSGADFDEWYENKRRIFGGDDGVEALNLPSIEAWLRSAPGDTVKIVLTANNLKLIA